MDRMQSALDSVDSIPQAVLVSRDMVVRRSYRRQLERLGFEVEEANCMPSNYGSQRVQIVLIDTQNPNEEIQAAATCVREDDDAQGWHTPIVGLGSALGYQERERWEELGFDDFVDLRGGSSLFREVLLLAVPGWAEELDGGHRRAA